MDKELHDRASWFINLPINQPLTDADWDNIMMFQYDVAMLFDYIATLERVRRDAAHDKSEFKTKNQEL